MVVVLCSIASSTHWRVCKAGWTRSNKEARQVNAQLGDQVFQLGRAQVDDLGNGLSHRRE